MIYKIKRFALVKPGKVASIKMSKVANQVKNRVGNRLSSSSIEAMKEAAESARKETKKRVNSHIVDSNLGTRVISHSRKRGGQVSPSKRKKVESRNKYLPKTDLFGNPISSKTKHTPRQKFKPSRHLDRGENIEFSRNNTIRTITDTQGTIRVINTGQGNLFDLHNNPL